MSQKFEKLKTLLKELFQLDQPDLDFGLYRIMHAKAAEVTQFLDRDLLPQVKAEFSQYKTADKAELEQQLAKAIEQAQSLGADPETLPKVKELRAKLAGDAVDITALESEVYDHLFGFFRRYYSEGDFLSKRVYKPGVYAIPFEGEEVKLHWANADQYYIKTSEYLRDYAFRLRPEDEANPMRVHFRLVDATEGEHGNVKSASGKDRIFTLAATEFISEEDEEQGRELVIRFEYRPATMTDWPVEVREKKSKPPTQKDATILCEQLILCREEDALLTWITELQKPHVKADGEQVDYSRLHAHLHRYVGRNTFDYFIHKDLGGFLRRELDFYIKNEVMHLDDVENETAPRVEQYLSKIRVIRRIAIKLIAFLSQLENFQKKLWLKKKFVIESNYCISLDRIPDALLAEIAANDAQRAEWVRLFAIDEIKADLTSPGYSVPLTLPFLKANSTLLLDTAFFTSTFKDKLLESISDLDASLSGILISGDNLHALSLLQPYYAGKIQCQFIDPPYNTGGDDFVYKDGFKDSSWMAMINDRIDIARSLLTQDGSMAATIDENEVAQFRLLLDVLFGPKNFIATIAWQKLYTVKNSAQYLSEMYDSIHIYARDKEVYRPNLIPRSDEQDEVYGNPDNDPNGPYITNALQARNYYSEGSYSLTSPGGRKIDGPPAGTFWRLSERNFRELDRQGRIWWGVSGTAMPRVKKYLKEIKDGVVPVDYWLHQFAGTNAESKTETRDMLGEDVVGLTPKPVLLLRRIIQMNCSPDGIVCDFFAGSGTTGVAVIQQNKSDQGSRRYLLVESGSYFDAVLKTRISKAVYSSDWSEGKPRTRDGVSQFFKYLRLESYEDALNNLVTPRRSLAQQSLLDAAGAQGADRLREQYILRYMLNVETEGSPSLLNIQAFTDPTSYLLKVKRPGSDESREFNVDLLETFNWLIGLKVEHLASPQRFSADVERDSEGRLELKMRRGSKQASTLREDPEGKWWFRTVTGRLPDGRLVLIVWRKRPGGETPAGVEEDNLILDYWLKAKLDVRPRDTEFALIYVNGTNNLENLRAPDDTWKVRLIEDDFHRLMFAAEAL